MQSELRCSDCAGNMGIHPRHLLNFRHLPFLVEFITSVHLCLVMLSFTILDHGLKPIPGER